MSNVARVAGQAANTLVKPLEVEQVFSTYLYDGNGASPTTITNDIDLSGEGGMVWTKNRDSAISHNLTYTDQPSNRLFPNTADAADTGGNNWSYASNGYTVTGNNDNFNGSGVSYASWTFRKAPKFFDVVTWTGNGVSGREIPHNLGSAPGMIIVKSLTEARQWMVYHRSTGNANALILNSTAASASTALWNSTDPTSTVFTLNNDGDVNTTGNTYVAYLFAHNDGDGVFGPNGNADAIKCGSYTGDGGAGTTEVNLGFEPQWILVKASSAADNWFVIDNMRGWATHNNTANDAYLLPNESNAESTGGFLDITSTGFKTTLYTNVNVSGREYIYIAIRRGTAVPESATDVFAITTQTGSILPAFDTGFVTDFSLRRENAVSNVSTIHAVDRLRGKPYLVTDGANAEINLNANTWDFMDGWYSGGSTGSNKYAWSWKRAPKYFDVVAYTGNSTAGRTVSHNLGVAPEMMWVKPRSATNPWQVYHSATGNTKAINFDTGTGYTATTYWNNTTPSSSDFTLGSSVGFNGSGVTYIAYLFATLAGISKVGSYTGNDSSQTIDCGFTSGARFVLIKSTTQSQPWYLFDSERGIVAGNDPYLQLNSTVPEDELGGIDVIDPHNSGFIVNTNLGGINDNNETYIFYAIA